MADAIVIGVSAGGLEALGCILAALPASFALPVAIVQHVAAHSDSYLPEYLNAKSLVTVKEAEDKENLQPGHVYLAPPGYHLLIEPNRTFALSVDPRVNYSRPAIDVLFESAADVLGSALIGVVLTGSNGDGSKGLKKIKACGGITVVQNPGTAEHPYMPQAALAAVQPDYVVDLQQIAPLLMRLGASGGMDYGSGTQS